MLYYHWTLCSIWTTDLPQVTDQLYHIMLYSILVWGGFELTTLVVIGTDCIDRYKSNYHTITSCVKTLIVQSNRYMFSYTAQLGWPLIQTPTSFGSPKLCSITNIYRIDWTITITKDVTDVRVMVFNATFNNISVITWQSVLLVEETGVPGENHRPITSHWQTLSYNVVLVMDQLFSYG
jgi:hypothetical protein